MSPSCAPSLGAPGWSFTYRGKGRRSFRNFSFTRIHHRRPLPFLLRPHTAPTDRRVEGGVRWGRLPRLTQDRTSGTKGALSPSWFGGPTFPVVLPGEGGVTLCRPDGTESEWRDSLLDAHLLKLPQKQVVRAPCEDVVLPWGSREPVGVEVRAETYHGPTGERWGNPRRTTDTVTTPGDRTQHLSDPSPPHSPSSPLILPPLTRGYGRRRHGRRFCASLLVPPESLRVRPRTGAVCRKGVVYSGNFRGPYK